MSQSSYTALVDSAPLDQVAALYDVWKTKNIKAPAAALAIVNFASYGAFLAVGQTVQVFGNALHTDADIEGAFAQARHPEMAAAAGGIIDNRPFLKILINVALQLLPLLIAA